MVLIDQTKKVPIDVKTIEMSAKCSDCFSATLRDQDGQKIADYEGYVPKFLGSDGDYVELKIDLNTGQILNWNPPTKAALEKLINQEEE